MMVKERESGCKKQGDSNEKKDMKRENGYVVIDEEKEK